MKRLETVHFGMTETVGMAAFVHVSASGTGFAIIPGNGGLSKTI
jgi:hypothetical protein